MPSGRVIGQQADDLAADLGEQLGVGQDLGAIGLAVFVVEKDQVDVGAVVELLAAQLTQPEYDKPSSRACTMSGVRRIEPRRGIAPAATATSTQASARSERSCVINSSGKPRTMSL